MKVRDLMTIKVETVSHDATLKEAADKMKILDIGWLPVVKAQEVVGILTDRDITINATSHGWNPNGTYVEDIMTPDVIYCFDDQDVNDAALAMERHQLRRLAVYDRMKKLSGVISVADFATKTRHDRLAARVLRHVCLPSHAHAAAA